ncbi:MAG TPA: hypothetical protein VFY29_19250 [Terriglobia bacterium]|nr:hypothetical protein [Terriglobia bacterium]
MKQQASERGFVLAAVLFFVTATAVVIATLLPSYIMEARRDTEDELIFRGAEYARAIRKFQNKYGYLPLTVDELMMGSDGIPSLRKRYLDPTNGEEFRPIYVNTDGSLQGSNLYLTLRDAITNQAQTLAESAEALANEAEANGDATGGGGGGGGTTNPGLGNQGTNLLNNQGTSLTGNQGTNLRGNQGTNLLSNQGTNLTNPGQNNTTTTPTTNTGTTGGTATAQTGLVGVGSQNDHMAIKKYVGQDRYINWEFIANVRRTVNRGGTNTGGTTTGTGATTGGGATGGGTTTGGGATGGGGFTGGGATGGGGGGGGGGGFGGGGGGFGGGGGGGGGGRG